MKHDILHCPHCGKRGKVLDEEFEPDFDTGPGPAFSWHEVWVCCSKCGAKGPAVEYRFADDGTEATKKAIALWNRRDNPNLGPYAQWEDGTLNPGEDPATEKQMRFAAKIAERFDLELPARKSKTEYMRFISKYKPRWDALFQRHDYDEDIPDDCPFDPGEFC